MQWSRMKIPTLLLAVVALVIGMSTGAVAAKLITGADIKDGSVTSADIKNGTLVTKDLKKGGVSADRLKKASIGSQKLAAGAVHSGKIKDGTIEAKDLSEAAKNSLKATYAGPNWSIVDRNVQGGGDSYLRAGPTAATATGIEAPPLGIGSLGIRTAGPSDKAAFGDQVDFAGQPFSDVTDVGYSVFATGEDFTGGATNLPSISFELDFNPTGPLSFHTLFYQPSIGLTDVNRWTAKDAVADTDAHWGISGVAGTTCDQNGSLCTFAQVQAFLATDAPDAQILTVQITKGSGQAAFSGAVDALRINNDVFDFEPSGVTTTTP
jgi:hypothetical protein